MKIISKRNRSFQCYWVMFALCRIEKNRTASDTMDHVTELFQSAVRDGTPDALQKPFVARLSRILLSRWCERSWFPGEDKTWGERQAEEAACYVFSKLQSIVNRKCSEASRAKNVTDLADHVESTLFFVPEVVALIYSPHAPTFDALAQEGGDCHCRLIRFATAHAVRRHAPGMKSFSMDTSELEDELWGSVMEEIVRCLSDTSARVWKKTASEPAVFPKEGTRGSKRGTVERIAMSKNGGRIAAIRSDRLLFVWDVKRMETIRTLDLSQLEDSKPQSRDRVLPQHLYFSNNGSTLALETEGQQIYCVPIDDPDGPIRVYDENSKDDFIQDFGVPFIPNLTAAELDGFKFHTKSGKDVSWPEYAENIFDWSSGSKPNRIATGSERYRTMPGWMRDAGFERAVFHIAKKRLIDLIRKQTHTNYACWQCGSFTSSPADTHCRDCGFDFTRCPIGCALSPDELLESANRWQCPRCGMASRTAEPTVEVELDERFTGAVHSSREWEDQHDFERIIQALEKITITHKRRQVPCNRLVILKSEGKTNEEIGRELGIPRGSVDYVWNQCKQQIVSLFGES